MTSIVVTAVVTFIIVSLWSKYSYTKGNKNLYVCFEALKNELDGLSRELGHEDIHGYWANTKGQEYADRGMENINNALKFLREA